MKRHLINAACGVIDYASYPLAMLLVGPYALHRLGLIHFGIWMVAGSIISSGGIVASGLTDANLQRVSKLLHSGDITAVRNTVRSMLALNLVVGLLLGIAVACIIPWLAAKVCAQHPSEIAACTLPFWIATACIPLRALHAVAVSTQRAFQDFRPSVRITTATHLLTLALAALFAWQGRGTVAILAATAAVLLLATAAQFRESKKLLGREIIFPTFHRESTRALFSHGIYVWLQTFTAVLADRFDRLLLGASLGAAAVAPYTFCVQLAQPLAGLTGSSLSFLMPHLAGLVAASTPARLRSNALIAFAVNLGIVAIGLAIVLPLGTHLLPHWLGPASLPAALRMFPRIAIGTACLALSVSGIYTLQALGNFRTLAAISISTRLLSFPLMFWLLHHTGAEGLATFRLIVGISALAVYAPLPSLLRTSGAQTKFVSTSHLGVHP